MDEHDVAHLAKRKPGRSLGADDGAGLWIMLNMVAAGVPGLYVFHRGEERGCLGSSWIKQNTPELLAGLDAAVAFDRQGFSDVITHQSYGRTCSDAFAKSIASALNDLEPSFLYEADPTGMYTDTNEYAGHIPECSNLSVGYFGNHGPNETLDVVHVEKLLAAMLALDHSKLVIARDPKEEPEDWWSRYETKWSRRKMTFADHVADYPEVAAALLSSLGITEEEFEAACWAADEETSAKYRSVMS